ncbi:hypothetical protein BC937DRAFT_89337 [Endogone sp. FLAS-F59071]|nr:hypothetical protein BC937DRAFT_89337 [Endogone sp. FLAS-F59071]|eukprot:RUS17932.1 hypothetical protein BC937DRAFT_89337 [Endogone sp. FLAS-F59071]
MNTHGISNSVEGSSSGAPLPTQRIRIRSKRLNHLADFIHILTWWDLRARVVILYIAVAGDRGLFLRTKSASVQGCTDECAGRKEELLEELDAAKVKIRRLKQENNTFATAVALAESQELIRFVTIITQSSYLLELMMEMDPDLAKDASDSSGDENDVSPLSTEEEERRTVTDEDDVHEDDSVTTSDRDLQQTVPDREDNNAPRGRSKQRGKRKVRTCIVPYYCALDRIYRSKLSDLCVLRLGPFTRTTPR